MLSLQSGLGTEGVIDLIRATTIVAQVVLLILAVFSILSWAVIIDRLILLRKAERESGQFLETFRTSSKFSQVRAACDRLKTTPLGSLFVAGYNELSGQLDDRKMGGGSDPPASGTRQVNLGAIERSLRRSAHSERRQLERMMLFLATTAAATPFIGLFGTVWGIMNAFHSIGTFGTANLAVVAPGISEALITTAAGLAAAIPAVIAYNHLLGRIRRLAVGMEDFGLEFLNVVEKTFPGAQQS